MSKIKNDAAEFSCVSGGWETFDVPCIHIPSLTPLGLVEVIILVGGEDDKVVLRSVESFDPATHAWKTLSCLPFAVSKHGLVANGTNCMFLAGGEFPDGSASRFGCGWGYTLLNGL